MFQQSSRKDIKVYVYVILLQVHEIFSIFHSRRDVTKVQDMGRNRGSSFK